jgi:hypothetical protein
MQLLTKEELFFQDYTWNTPEDSYKLKGTPDRNLFIPSEGYEVLYLVNHTAEVCGFKTKEEAIMIEKLLRDKLPINKWSQVNVDRWLQKELEIEMANKPA